MKVGDTMIWYRGPSDASQREEYTEVVVAGFNAPEGYVVVKHWTGITFAVPANRLEAPSK